MKRFIPLYVALWLFAIAASGWTQEKEVSAREMVMQATQAFADSKYTEAAQKFRKAYQKKPSWKRLYSLAQAKSAGKRYGLVLSAFEQFPTDGGDEIGVERRDLVIEEIRRLREMVASLDVIGPIGARVFVNGAQRGTVPLEGLIKLPVGRWHNVLVVIEGKSLLERTIRLSGGEKKVLVVRKDSDNQEQYTPVGIPMGSLSLLGTQGPVGELSKEDLQTPLQNEEQADTGIINDKVKDSKKGVSDQDRAFTEKSDQELLPGELGTSTETVASSQTAVTTKATEQFGRLCQEVDF